MKLNQIADRPGAKQQRTRVGRGIGSGKGKTGGRGGKGQTARSGVRIKGFEGGQMPLHRRLPKRGFRNTAFQLVLNELNVGKVQAAINSGSLDIKNPVDIAALVKAGLISRVRDGVKLLGHGELKAKVDFTVWRASKSAIAAVEKAGGSVKILAPAKEVDAEPRGKNARFAAGLDKPKIIESAPTPTKADAKKKADAKEEARLAPKTDRKPTNPAGKAS